MQPLMTAVFVQPKPPAAAETEADTTVVANAKRSMNWIALIVNLFQD